MAKKYDIVIGGMTGVTATPDGCNEMSCLVCEQVIYPDARVIDKHSFDRLPDGRIRIVWLVGNYVVHECDIETLATSVVTETLDAVMRAAYEV